MDIDRLLRVLKGTSDADKRRLNLEKRAEAPELPTLCLHAPRSDFLIVALPSSLGL